MSNTSQALGPRVWFHFTTETACPEIVRHSVLSAIETPPCIYGGSGGTLREASIAM